ncbi:hypothetical protein DYU05_09535 [Mucilaginibacter terrenus]|uniref:Uncharacterized protein n=1 Tax=Mucilaginibacter terrenus TaxID=2482727 RepID=A0A3E2NXS1_9SPHI|nr:hypothetical protein [Mucilaginibacter terrenus]RFZ85814.1 hypothetical protein DYU05_09535 [Mucilaginibacter terrenus]
MIPDNDDFDKVDPDYRDADLANNGEDTASLDDLNFNEAENSFEYDVKGDDPDYDHPDPYDTAIPNGDDFNSTYDEANPYDTKGEYDATRSIETDADSLGMHIDGGKIVELDPLDAKLAHTPEDDRDDLDEEGYPINDTPKDIR